MPTLNARSVATGSERIILGAGGRICKSLPLLVVDPKALRTVDELRARAMVLGALVKWGLSLSSGKEVLAWVRKNRVARALTRRERNILSSARPKRADRMQFTWHVEALAGLLWAGGLIDALDFKTFAPESMRPFVGAALDGLRLRPYAELFRALDLHYRLDWYVVDGNLNGYSTNPVNAVVIAERRHALEWLLDSSTSWDEVSLDT